MQGYHGPIDVTGSANLKAVAVAPGFLKSSISSAAYTITAPPSHIISTVAGSGKPGFSGAGGPATSALLWDPTSVAIDASGNLYISDYLDFVVWKVNSSGVISIFAGNGIEGYSGDGAAATSAELSYPTGIAFDKSGNLYIADAGNSRVRMVAADTGIITTFAGGGLQSANNGDGGPATQATLNSPEALAFDSKWNLLIADTYHGRIRMVEAETGIITTVAGSGSQFPGRRRTGHSRCHLTHLSGARQERQHLSRRCLQWSVSLHRRKNRDHLHNCGRRQSGLRRRRFRRHGYPA